MRFGRSDAVRLRIDASRTKTAAAFGHNSPLPGDQPLTVARFELVSTRDESAGGNRLSANVHGLVRVGTIVTLHRKGGMWQPGVYGGRTRSLCALVVDTPTEVDISPPAHTTGPRASTEALIEVAGSGPGLVTSSDGRIRCGRSREPRAPMHGTPRETPRRSCVWGQEHDRRSLACTRSRNGAKPICRS